MSTSIAFAHDLPPICLTIFSFSNILCGTSRILGGPISISIAFAHALIQVYLVLFTYCRFVSLCTRNPGFHSSNPRSARVLRLSCFRPSFRIVLADVCGPECRKTSLCMVFAKIAFSPTPNVQSNTQIERYALLYYSKNTVLSPARNATLNNFTLSFLCF